MVRKRENIQWAAVVWMKMSCWGQRRMGRPVRDDRKATVTQINTRYNQGMQNASLNAQQSNPEADGLQQQKTRERVPLLSAKNRKRRLQFAQAHQNWTIEDRKMLPGLKSLDFCCNIQMVGLEFGVKNIKAWIHPALSQWIRLVVV